MFKLKNRIQYKFYQAHTFVWWNCRFKTERLSDVEIHEINCSQSHVCGASRGIIHYHHLFSFFLSGMTLNKYNYILYFSVASYCRGD